MDVVRFQSEIFAGVFVLTWILLRFVLSIRQPFRPNVLTHWSDCDDLFRSQRRAYLAGSSNRRGNGDLPDQLRNAGGTTGLLLGLVSPHAALGRGAARIPEAFTRSGPIC